ncbi:unnamed protein product, partial [Closterium sp. Naga37s-1]
SLMAPSAASSGSLKVLVARGGEVRRGEAEEVTGEEWRRGQEGVRGEELKGQSVDGGVAAAPSPAAEGTPLVFNVLSDVVSFTFPPAPPPQPESHPPAADPRVGPAFLSAPRSRLALASPLIMIGFTLPDPCDPSSDNTPCADMQAQKAEPESTVTPQAGALAPTAAPVAAATPIPPAAAAAAAAVVVVQGFALQEVLSSAINASLPASPAIAILFHPHTTPTPTSPPPSPPSSPSSSLQPHGNPPVDGWQLLDARLLWQQQQPGVATFSALRPGLYAVAVQETNQFHLLGMEMASISGHLHSTRPRIPSHVTS